MHTQKIAADAEKERRGSKYFILWMRGTGNAVGKATGLSSTGVSCKEDGLILGDGRCRKAVNGDLHLIQQLAITALSFFPSPLEGSSSLQLDVSQLLPLHTVLRHCQI